MHMRNIVYYDLETQKSADEVGGWDKVRDMRMSVAVTYSTARGGYRIYGEKDVDELLTARALSFPRGERPRPQTKFLLLCALSAS